MPQKVAFVTVGTTKFDALIEAMDSLAITDELAVQGYTDLVMQENFQNQIHWQAFTALQIGDGNYSPHIIVPLTAMRSNLPSGLQVEMFRYAPDLARHMSRAQLVISHAGSGSLFEALKIGKPIIAVPNSILMANHQAELAEHLDNLGHCKMATPDTLLEVLQSFDASALKPYQPGNAHGIVEAINRHLGL